MPRRIKRTTPARQCVRRESFALLTKTYHGNRGTENLRTGTNLLSAFAESIAPSDYFEFTPDCVFNGNYRVHLENKRRKH